MYKVLVADDEHIIIKGIEKLFSTCINDFEISASAGDGDEAFELLKSQSFDVMITDIRMPGLDGLALIKKARLLYPDMIIIILSGFEEIEYYQKAIKGGVFAYLLKPIDIKEFIELFNRLCDVLSEIEKAKKLLKVSFLNNLLLQNNFDKLTIHQNMKKYQINLVCPNLFAIAIHIDNEVILQNEIGSNELDILKENIISVSSRFFQKYNGVFFMSNSEKIVGFLNYTGNYANSITAFNLFCKEFIDFICDQLFISISVGIGKPCSDFRDLDKSYESAVEACKIKYYSGHGSVNPFNILNTQSDKVLDISLERNILLEAVHRLDFKALKDELDKINSFFRETKPRFVEIEKIYYQILITLEEGFRKNKFFNQPAYPSEMFSIEKVKCMETINDITEWILSLSERLILAASEHLNTNSTKAIRCAVNFIDNNFNKNISLNDVAHEIYMHPVYFSQLFKSEMGLSFTVYINNLRMEKAKLYLKELKYKIRDIAQMLGYSDEKHFYKVFKRSTGMTPNEYRNKNS